jgi:hypothetical protein
MNYLSVQITVRALELRMYETVKEDFILLVSIILGESFSLIFIVNLVMSKSYIGAKSSKASKCDLVL